MDLRFIGAGVPRTGTTSLKRALERLLGGDCLHMSAIPGHPFDLGPDWDAALSGTPVDWRPVLAPYVAAVDWPTAAFWREISEAVPSAFVLLSYRDSPQVWLHSMESTVLPVARMTTAADWNGGDALVRLLKRFTRSDDWDGPSTLLEAYERQLADVRAVVPPDRLVEWTPSDGWEPLCEALALPVPDEPFPWLNRRAEWG